MISTIDCFIWFVNGDLLKGGAGEATIVTTRPQPSRGSRLAIWLPGCSWRYSPFSVRVGQRMSVRIIARARHHSQTRNISVPPLASDHLFLKVLLPSKPSIPSCLLSSPYLARIVAPFPVIRFCIARVSRLVSLFAEI